MSVLDDIVVGVREDLARRQAETPEPDLRARILDLPPALDPLPVFGQTGSSVIAEVKRRSPSKGDLAEIPEDAALPRRRRVHDLRREHQTISQAVQAADAGITYLGAGSEARRLLRGPRPWVQSAACQNWLLLRVVLRP